MRSLRSHLSAAVLVLAGAFVIQACGKQGVGERCEGLSQSTDCESGLVCVSNGSAEVCCPPNATDCGKITATPTDGGVDTATATDTGAPEADAEETGDAADTADTAPADTGAALDAEDAG